MQVNLLFTACGEGQLILRVNDFDVRLGELESRPLTRHIWLAKPDYFDIEYVINPHMADQLGMINKEKAEKQWDDLRTIYLDLGFEVSVVRSVAGFPDLVFVANQSFPGINAVGELVGVCSRMFAVQRRGEVSVVEKFYQDKGIKTLSLPGDGVFEGTGDALWYPGRRLIVGGYGFRTEPKSLRQLGAILNVPVVALELKDPRFYHLDTCLSMLNEETALYVPGAFIPESVALLKRLVPNLVPLPFRESVEGLACNGYCPDGKNYIVHRTNEETMKLVSDMGFSVISVDTSEFIKSGGSVFCMKLEMP